MAEGQKEVVHLGLEKFSRKVRRGEPLKPGEDIIIGGTRRFGKIEITWWGSAQKYKWRRHLTHIDLGWLSIYNLPKWVVRVVGFLIKPMRVYYHGRYCGMWRLTDSESILWILTLLNLVLWTVRFVKL